MDRPEGKDGITKDQFNKVIDRANDLLGPIITKFGGTLQINRLWDDATVNADSSQDGTSWVVNMYGGLARRPEITVDGFAMVLCHELGHHLGGYPYYSGDTWAANEGQADTFATGHCAKLIWANDPANADSRATVPAVPKAKCDQAYTKQDELDLCYRTVIASKSLGDLLAALEGAKVDFSTPDTSEVTATNDDHPAAQCRLDTYVASALCNLSWDSTVIPGKTLGAGNNSKAEQDESAKFYCMDDARQYAERPRCWFKAL
jgi:hypothetical protein